MGQLRGKPFTSASALVNCVPVDPPDTGASLSLSLDVIASLLSHLVAPWGFGDIGKIRGKEDFRKE